MAIENRRNQSEVEFALLGYLYQRPMHAYEMHQHLVSHGGLGLVWNLNQGRLYALLAKLERQGLITSQLEPQVGRPPRKILHLSEHGRDSFLAWLHAPVTGARNMRMEFMAKLVFLRELNPAEAAVLLDEQRDLCEEWLTSLNAQADALQATESFEWLVFKFRIGQVQAMLNWIATCQGIVEHGVSDAPVRHSSLASPTPQGSTPG